MEAVRHVREPPKQNCPNDMCVGTKPSQLRMPQLARLMQRREERQIQARGVMPNREHANTMLTI